MDLGGLVDHILTGYNLLKTAWPQPCGVGAGVVEEATVSHAMKN